MLGVELRVSASKTCAQSAGCFTDKETETKTSNEGSLRQLTGLGARPESMEF